MSNSVGPTLLRAHSTTCCRYAITKAINPSAVNRAAAGKMLNRLVCVMRVPTAAPIMKPMLTGMYAKDITRPRTLGAAAVSYTHLTLPTTPYV